MTPLIARAALFPHFIIPGVTRVEGISQRDLESRARFANAIFTPGNLDGAREVLQQNIYRHLCHGLRYDVRAVPLTQAEMESHLHYRYHRPGYAVLWVTGEDVIGDDDYIALGTYVAGEPVQSLWGITAIAG